VAGAYTVSANVLWAHDSGKSPEANADGYLDRAAGGAKCPIAQKLQTLNRRAAAAIGGTREISRIEFRLSSSDDARRLRVRARFTAVI